MKLPNTTSYVFQSTLSSVCFITCIVSFVFMAKGEMKHPRTARTQLLLCMLGFSAIFSAAFAFGPLFMVPKSNFTAIGNQGSCYANAFMASFGCIGSLNYTMAIAFYNYKLVESNMPHQLFREKYGKMIHIGGILFNFIISCCFLFTKMISIGPSRLKSICLPLGKEDNDNPTHIISTQQKVAFLTISIICATCVVGMILFTMKLYFHVKKMETKVRNTFRQSLTLRQYTDFEPTTDSNLRTSSSPRLRSCPNLIRSIWSSQESETPIRLTKTQILAKRRRRQILTQTTLYVSAFVLTSTWPILFSLWYAIDGRGPPTLLLLLGEILAPFNGVFVTVIAARIYVKTIRKNSEYSYFRAFWIVLQNGLEIPPEYLPSRRRVSTSQPTSTGSRRVQRLDENISVDNHENSRENSESFEAI